MAKGRTLGSESLRIINALIEARALDCNELWSLVLQHQPSLDRRQLQYKLYNLQRQGYIQARKKNNVSFFHVTPRGKLRALKFIHLEKLRQGKWDGRWRVIIFDIPETLKKWREYLRKELKQLGFYPLQESVYITPYPVTGELDEVLKEWNLRKHFRYLTVSEIDNEKEFKAVFDLYNPVIPI